MLSAQWWHFLYGLGHYIIFLGAISNTIIIANNFMTLCYTYNKRRLKNPPDIFCQISHIS